MDVRCEKCGHENDPQFLFCGMCGQRLSAVPSQNAAQEAEKLNPPEPSNPSAGLLFPPTGELNAADRAAYLLHDEDEDEHPRHTGRLYLALAFLIISLVLLAIHWRQYAHSWLTAYVARSAATNPGEAPEEAAPEAPAPTAATPQPTPAPSKPAPKSVKPPAEPAATPAVDVPVSTERLPADLQAQSLSAQNQPVQSSPAQSSAVQPVTNQNSAKPTPAPASARVEKSAASTEASSADATSAPSSIADESPAAQGERYLYGNGVPQDCALARKNLAIAADRKNSRALTLMGTMYATGHCAPRDLPTAYGWFAQALHTDPSNRRIEDDLSLIWKQMTPSEKQIALKKQD